MLSKAEVLNYIENIDVYRFFKKFEVYGRHTNSSTGRDQVLKNRIFFSHFILSLTDLSIT